MPGMKLQLIYVVCANQSCDAIMCRANGVLMHHIQLILLGEKDKRSDWAGNLLYW